MEILENNKTVLVKGNVIGFEKSTLEPSKYLVQFPDLTTASLSVDMIEDEPQAGHADEAPRHVKNILARLRELPLHDREVWLKAIMAEFEQDFSRAKWREGYEQGKFEGALEADKKRVVVPQYIAEWIDYCKWRKISLAHALYRSDESVDKRVFYWIVDSLDNQETFALAWIFGYTVEEEKRYLVKVKNVLAGSSCLIHGHNNEWYYGHYYDSRCGVHHTRKELEEAGFGWVFSCEGIEIEEVEE